MIARCQTVNSSTNCVIRTAYRDSLVLKGNRVMRVVGLHLDNQVSKVSSSTNCVTTTAHRDSMVLKGEQVYEPCYEDCTH